MISEINTSKYFFYSKYFHFHFGALDYLFELFDKDVLPYLQEQIDIYSSPSFSGHRQAQQLKEYYLKMYIKHSEQGRGEFRVGRYNKINYICNLFSSRNEFNIWTTKKTERFKSDTEIPNFVKIPREKVYTQLSIFYYSL